VPVPGDLILAPDSLPCGVCPGLMFLLSARAVGVR
jgi:hypothetical protein